ncbi:MAG: PIG-L family deacetylase [Gemmatimonadota bacterium]|nr:PIG-L family deacetylase [Gemmatimonadota bacterium]
MTPTLHARALLTALLLSLAAPLNPWAAVGTGAVGSTVTAQSLDGTGTVAAGLLLRRLEGVKRVLMIGAHPDDEDTGFLTAVARGMGAETAYLSLTRGGGGQNLIGPELFEGLAVIRTGELEAARELDGGRQRFTRAFDFGYSKTAEETLTFWEKDELLRDVVWAIRTFRPHVVVSVFSGTPSDGHGHHQAAGIMAREAFAAAGDPERYPEQLSGDIEPWAPAKLLRTSRRRFAPNAPEIEGEIVVPIGRFDPLLGRSSFQLAMEGRSQHRSQDMGTAQPAGPRSSGAVVVDARVPNAEEGLFSGIDTTLVGLTEPLPDEVAAAAADHLEAYRAAVARARDGFSLDPGTIVDDLTQALAALDAAAETVESGTGLARELAHKRSLTERALMAAAGVVFDVRAEDDIVVPGQTVEVEALLWNGGGASVRAPEVSLRPREAWETRQVGLEGVTDDGRIPAGALATWRFEVEVPEDADVSRLYYLREERDGPMYRWPEDRSLWGLPRDPADVVGRATLTVEGSAGAVRVRHEADWRYVGVDQAYGEFVEPVLVLPRVSVTTQPSGMAWPETLSETREVTVAVRTEAEEGARGMVRLEAPAGWRVSPDTRAFDLPAAGSERSLSYSVTPGDVVDAGEEIFRAVATDETGARYEEGFSLIDYDHIERAALFEPAETRVAVVPVRVPEELRVGYIMGTGDDGAEAIRQMGADVELLGEDRVRDGDFDDFDVLVLGVRAYEARPDVRAANEQILDFARAGGVVVNQYNQYQFSNGGFAPHGLSIDRPAARVSVETQPVTILEPDAPVFTTPNRIGPEDFEGWVQERGLYFASEWDDAYRPMLEMNDPGEPPRRGSLLVSSVGDGVYAYAALSFFRQWSQRVPGAYRLFANLISLDPESWRAWVSETEGGNAPPS